MRGPRPLPHSKPYTPYPPRGRSRLADQVLHASAQAPWYIEPWTWKRAVAGVAGSQNQAVSLRSWHLPHSKPDTTFSRRQSRRKLDYLARVRWGGADTALLPELPSTSRHLGGMMLQKPRVKTGSQSQSAMTAPSLKMPPPMISRCGITPPSGPCRGFGIRRSCTGVKDPDWSILDAGCVLNMYKELKQGHQTHGTGQLCAEPGHASGLWEEPSR